MWRSGPGKRTNYMEQNMPVMQSALTPMQDNFYHSMAECMLRGVPPPPTRPRTPEPEGTERPPPVGNAFYQDSRFFYKPPVESERAMCTICAKCDEDAPDPAEYKCYSCVKYDARGKGHFCKACFKARHPPHRVKHVWQRIENEENLDEAANDQLVRAEMDKQIAGINATIQVVSRRVFVGCGSVGGGGGAANAANAANAAAAANAANIATQETP